MKGAVAGGDARISWASGSRPPPGRAGLGTLCAWLP